MKDDIKVMSILRIKGSKQRTGKALAIQMLLVPSRVEMSHDTQMVLGAITAINEQKPKFKIGTFMIPGKEKDKA